MPSDFANNKDCKLFVFTYRDMCWRCSTMFHLKRGDIKERLKAKSLEIISVSLKEHTDQINIPQGIGKEKQEAIGNFCLVLFVQV